MSSPRVCPKCPVSTSPLPMQVRTVEGREPGHTVEIDQCPRCLGVWLDRHEPRKLWELRDWLFGVAASAHVQEDLQAGACPACPNHPVMQRIPVGAFGVDLCRQCAGTWFDGGELAPCLTDQGYTALVRALNAAWRAGSATHQ